MAQIESTGEILTIPQRERAAIAEIARRCERDAEIAKHLGHIRLERHLRQAAANAREWLAWVPVRLKTSIDTEFGM